MTTAVLMEVDALTSDNVAGTVFLRFGTSANVQNGSRCNLSASVHKMQAKFTQLEDVNDAMAKRVTTCMSEKASQMASCSHVR